MKQRSRIRNDSTFNNGIGWLFDNGLVEIRFYIAWMLIARMSIAQMLIARMSIVRMLIARKKGKGNSGSPQSVFNHFEGLPFSYTQHSNNWQINFEKKLFSNISGNFCRHIRQKTLISLLILCIVRSIMFFNNEG